MYRTQTPPKRRCFHTTIHSYLFLLAQNFKHSTGIFARYDYLFFGGVGQKHFPAIFFLYDYFFAGECERKKLSAVL